MNWAALSNRPRETRDTLFLLAVIAWTVLPHTSHLPLWCSAMAGCWAWRCPSCAVRSMRRVA